jgi:predicted ATPase
MRYLKIKLAGNYSHSSEGLGDGVISLMFIADALHDSPEGSMLVIDEPELSLHPSLLRRLSRVLAE